MKVNTSIELNFTTLRFELCHSLDFNKSSIFACKTKWQNPVIFFQKFSHPQNTNREENILKVNLCSPTLFCMGKYHLNNSPSRTHWTQKKSLESRLWREMKFSFLATKEGSRCLSSIEWRWKIIETCSIVLNFPFGKSHLI
jgi:hypothetical protein